MLIFQSEYTTYLLLIPSHTLACTHKHQQFHLKLLPKWSRTSGGCCETASLMEGQKGIVGNVMNLLLFSTTLTSQPEPLPLPYSDTTLFTFTPNLSFTSSGILPLCLLTRLTLTHQSVLFFICSIFSRHYAWLKSSPFKCCIFRINSWFIMSISEKTVRLKEENKTTVGASFIHGWLRRFIVLRLPLI